MRCSSRLPLLALVVAVIGLYPLLAPTAHRIDQGHFELIQNGMTRADVEAIFSVPPGAYDWAEPDGVYLMQARYLAAIALIVRRQTAAATISVGEDLGIARLERAERTTSERWTSRHGVFDVRFGADGAVVSKRASESVRIVPPWQRWWKAIRER